MRFEREHKSVFQIIVNELITIAICGGIAIVTTTIFLKGFHEVDIVKQVFYGILIGYPLFKGNALTGYFMAKLFPWNKGPLRALILSLSAGMTYSMIAIVGINLMWYNTLSSVSISITDIFESNVFYIMVSELLITIIITMGYYLASFFKEWKKLLIHEEQLKREALSLQFDALKNQVNPHFLFNSLNVLTSLVETDPPHAVRFIKQLSEVYRYVLEHKDKELIELNTELQFVNAYIYLQKIRFDTNLRVDLSLDNISGRIIPLSLQMLLENAIKHNIISTDQPLNIVIFAEDNYIIVKNNLQKKTVIHETGSIGLNNIRERYAFFSKLPVIIEETEDMFTVKLPLIES